ncbi:hypothetical protein G9A89_010253 [Geosiphon pyriformis]|nr:hypothetical protein G9A89_010253 [Geosiphon pyriformis]
MSSSPSEPKDQHDKSQKDSEKEVVGVTMIELFRFSSTIDKWYMLLGTLAAMGNGAALPVMTIIFSNITQAFANFTNDKDDPNLDFDQVRDTLRDEVRKNVIVFCTLGLGVCVLSYIQMAFWMIAGENQAKRIRKTYYAAILRQDIPWFDSISTGDLTTRITGDVTLLQEGISEKIGAIIQYFTTFLTGFIVAFIKGWKLSLVLCAAIPLVVIAAGGMAKALSAGSLKGQGAYASAGAVAEQVFSGIRTVAAFGGEQREIQRYIQKLNTAYQTGKKKAFFSGVGVGLIMFILYCTYALAFWYGSKLVVSRDQTPGQVLNVFFSILVGALALGNAAPNISSVGNALGAAAKLYDIIDRIPAIDKDNASGKKLTKSAVKGKIEFKNIDFHYPQRPDVPILKNFNLSIEPGQTVALVGSSGSGKSTIVSLLERFYDPIKGGIFLDGENITDINIKSLRTQIGLVGQEPVLFPETIAQNIKWGAAPDDKESTNDEIIEACKKSNAHEFINDLPDKYNSLVGEKGALLSGGQKQRIAIARALIKNPAILLLDEATSALDTESERLVQDAIDAAATNRTTIVVAHRLSTIKNADKIVVMSNGEILEIGRHDELIAKEGIYYGLVKAQELKTKEDAEKANESDDEDLIEGDDYAITMAQKSNEKHLSRIATRASSIKSFEIKRKEEILMKQNMPLIRVFKLNMPELPLIIGGSFAAIVNGSVMPIFSLILSTLLDVLSNTDHPKQLRKDANFWAGMFVVLASVSFFTQFVQVAFFGLSGERLTRRIRILTFATLLKQEMGFFDDEDNGTGALTSKLANDASKVEGLSGSLMGSIVSSLSSVVVGLLIGFIRGWKMTLVVSAAAPLLIISGALQMKAIGGYSAQTRKAYEESGRIVQQSVSNIRTIAALAREETFKEMYETSIEAPHKVSIKGAAISSIGFGASQGLQFFVWALAFWYGGELVGNQEYSQKQMLNVMFAVIFTFMSIGQLSAFAPNTAKAKVAALSIFEILDRKSLIDPTNNEGKVRPAPVSGKANVKGAHFNYPARPHLRILRGLNVDIQPNKTVALVGASGSGKSTIVSLLLRYYDLLSGQVTVEGADVREWNMEYLRSQMAIVGQEPVLFDLTIGENIAYGKEGCSQEEIEEAATNANIHSFISNLPHGYNTPVGERGTQLSGGQKQRIAIARALIRHPKILLLDEATSALDSESEKVVQDALDKASEGRTTVTIAHRLSTIQNADLILVVKKGKVVEQGKHLELIEMKGLYKELVNKQMLIKEE